MPTHCGRLYGSVLRRHPEALSSRLGALPRATLCSVSWTNLVPAIGQARRYRREWFSKDIAAGVVITGMLAPAGMAYATAAGLPAVTGLYATIVPLLVYAIFGPSRILVMGPDSSLTPLIVASMVPLLADGAAGGGADAVAIAGALSILAGVMCIGAGLARFGFAAELLSTPVRIGYLQGIAATIIVAQAAKLSGFSVKGETIAQQARGFIDGVSDGRINTWALAAGAASIVLIIALKTLSPRIPATLVVVIGGIVIALLTNFAARGVPLVGDLPQGLPTPAVPDVDFDTMRQLLTGAVGVAFVAFADTSVVSRSMALRRGEHIDSNHELVALGLCNVASGFTQGFPISASNSRTPVAEASGARTQLTGVVAAVTLLVVTLTAPSAFRHLPDTSLAAIVIAAAISLIDLPAMARLWRVRRSEFFLAVTATIGVAVLGPVTGVMVAIALSILNFLRKAWKPYTTELVRVTGLKGYHDRSRHPEGDTIPGLVLYRFDAPLFFANARHFSEDVQRVVEERTDQVRCVIVTAEPITDIDTTAADSLKELDEHLSEIGVELRFAELKGQVRDRLDQFGVFADPARDDARTVGEAVKRYLRQHEVQWVDWEDRDAIGDAQSDPHEQPDGATELDTGPPATGG